MMGEDFYANKVSKKYNQISGQDKLKGVLFTKLITKTNEMIDSTNNNKNSILNNINEMRKR